MGQLQQIRQGDILLVAVDHQPPKNARLTTEVVLAEGELTGHAHRLRAAQVLEWEVAGQRYIRVLGDEPGTLNHEEHDPVPVAVVQPETTYRVVLQREWNLAGQWRKVID